MILFASFITTILLSFKHFDFLNIQSRVLTACMINSDLSSSDLRKNLLSWEDLMICEESCWRSLQLSVSGLQLQVEGRKWKRLPIMWSSPSSFVVETNTSSIRLSRRTKKFLKSAEFSILNFPEMFIVWLLVKILTSPFLTSEWLRMRQTSAELFKSSWLSLSSIRLRW